MSQNKETDEDTFTILVIRLHLYILKTQYLEVVKKNPSYSVCTVYCMYVCVGACVCERETDRLKDRQTAHTILCMWEAGNPGILVCVVALVNLYAF